MGQQGLEMTWIVGLGVREEVGVYSLIDGLGLHIGSWGSFLEAETRKTTPQ